MREQKSLENSPLTFLLQVMGMDRMDRTRIRTWSEFIGPQTEEEVRRCAAKASARGSGGAGSVTMT